MGGCGWTRCPRNSVSEPHSPRYGPFLVSGCWCTWRSFWGFLAPFWAVSRTYRGVRGHQRSLGHEKLKPHVECSSRLPSFGCFEPLLGLFWAKNGCFWPKTAQIWEGTSQPGATAFGPPPVNFWLKTWIWQGHHLGCRMSKVESGPRRWEGAMAKTARRRVVVVACLLVSYI